MGRYNFHGFPAGHRLWELSTARAGSRTLTISMILVDTGAATLSLHCHPHLHNVGKVLDLATVNLESISDERQGSNYSRALWKKLIADAKSESIPSDADSRWFYD